MLSRYGFIVTAKQEGEMPRLDFLSKKELVRLIYWLMDGIDGYACEVGSTERYWKPEAIKRAREVLEYVASKEREERKQREGRSKGRKE